jgi:hypothetical protein
MAEEKDGLIEVPSAEPTKPAEGQPASTGTPAPQAEALEMLFSDKTRPEYVDEKFWNAETGGIRIKGLAEGYKSVASLLGKRVQDLSPDEKAKLVDLALPQLEGPLTTKVEKALREKLAADDEFLSPLRESIAKKLDDDRRATLPEKYEVDAALADKVPTDDPLYGIVSEWAKEEELSPKAWNSLMTKVAALRDDMPPVEDRRKEVGVDDQGRDYKAREKTVVVGVLGSDVATLRATGKLAAPEGELADGLDLLKSVKTPGQFRALERLIARAKEPPMNMGDGSKPIGDLDAQIREKRAVNISAFTTAQKAKYNEELLELHNRRYGGTAA